MKIKMFNRNGVVMLGMALVVLLSSCGNKKKEENMTEKFKAFLSGYEDTVKKLSKELNLASWNAEISGKDEDYKKVEDLSMQLTHYFTNKDKFELLKKIKESGEVKDELLARQLELIYNGFLSNQADTAKLNEIIKLETVITQKFNTFRAVAGKDSLTDNQVEDILLNSADNKKLEETWKASKSVGKLMEADIKKVVKLRNALAKDLGFKNYHEMSLKLSEQDPAEIEKIFNDLDNLTRDAFAKLKGQIDSALSKKYKIPVEKLMPWHYQNRFFQEAPKIYSLDLDKYYAGKDLVKITSDYYSSLGIDISDIMNNSDLFEKTGKNQHAFCTDIDNEGDVRVLCNVKSNAKWMNTMLHEFGHAAYDKYIGTELPYTLREPAHIFTTEAVAMIFGRLASNAYFMQHMLGISDADRDKIKEDAIRYTRLEQLVFSRWAQVMYRFEKSMYENPDQDLNKLWWDLVEKYQMLKRPEGRNEPDWASKIHIATSPCYYHNYLLGELFASQMNHYIVKNVLKINDINGTDYFGSKEVGQFFVEKIFKPGARYQWNEMIEKATGEKLTPKYYAEQFVN